jgi:hypothetical protein
MSFFKDGKDKGFDKLPAKVLTPFYKHFSSNGETQKACETWL